MKSNTDLNLPYSIQEINSDFYWVHDGHNDYNRQGYIEVSIYKNGQLIKGLKLDYLGGRNSSEKDRKVIGTQYFPNEDQVKNYLKNYQAFSCWYGFSYFWDRSLKTNRRDSRAFDYLKLEEPQ